MSWQDYVDTQLVATGQIEGAALLSVTDASSWAATPNFCARAYQAKVTQEDGREVNRNVNEASLLVSLVGSGRVGAEGLRFNGEKFMVLRTNADPFTVYGKKPRGGVCITKTRSAIIVGTYNEEKGQTSGGCNMAVEALGDYLRGAGF